MNYLKTIFITTILLNISIILAPDYKDYGIAYTTEPPTNIEELLKPAEPTTVATPKEEMLTIEDILKQETPTSTETKTFEIEGNSVDASQNIPQKEKTELQKWDDHLSTLSENWNAANNIPSGSWKSKAFELAERVLEKDKNASETLKSSFLEALNTQTTKIDQSIVNLIKEFDDIIAAKLSSLETSASQEKKATIPTEASKPILPEEIKQEVTPFDSFPTATENPFASGATEASTAQTSESAGSTQEQAENQLLKQWDELLITMKKSEISKDEANKALDKAIELVAQLKNKKTPQELKKEFDAAFEILSLRKILHPADLKLKKDAFNRALFPEEYQQTEQYEQDAYQQNLFAEQEKRLQNELKKFREEATAKETLEKEKREKSEKQVQAALALATKQQKISEEQARNFKEQTKAHTEQLASSALLRLDKTISAEEQKARDAFAQTINQQTAAAKKMAEEQKAAANQGIFSKAMKMVSDTASSWLGYGANTPVSQALNELEEKQELIDLKTYLATTTKSEYEKNTIVTLWNNLQKKLREAPLSLDNSSVISNQKWIEIIEQILKELVITHHILTVDQAGIRVKKALPLPTSTGHDYGVAIVNTIKAYLNNMEWEAIQKKRREEADSLEISQARQERKEQIMLAQQKIKNDEDRIETEKKKQLLAATNYKNEKKEWNQLIAQLSQNSPATAEENNAHTLEAIKKSHSLLQLASAIPSKNKHAVSQKLKQKFTVALLDQQKFNDDKLNIHHNMDQFNKEINRILE